MADLPSWITEARTGTDVTLRKVPLNAFTHWRYGTGGVTHEDPRFFDVIGVRAEPGFVQRLH